VLLDLLRARGGTAIIRGGEIRIKIKIRIKTEGFEVEFAGAEGAFGFLDGGVAFADGGVAGAADDEVDTVEEVEVGGFVGAGEGEFEGGLFEDVE
jgi:hypothetical protein